MTETTTIDVRTKFCGMCERDLPRDAFALDLRRTDGRKSACKDCRHALGLH